MHPALRYTVSLGVGLIVTIFAVKLATTDHLITLSLVPLYGAATSMILAHRKQWFSLSQGSSNRSARKRGATIGGIGAFTLSLLLQASVPAGLAGFGLMVLGIASAIGDFDEL